MLGYFDRRQKLIADEIASGQQAHAEGEAFKQQYAQQLKGAKNEACLLYTSTTTPIEVLPNEIVETQSLNLDAITGATITSAAVKSAVAEAVKQAGADPEVLKACLLYTSGTVAKNVKRVLKR